MAPMSEALLAVRRQAEHLSVEEQLQLIAYLAERIRQAGQQPVPRRQWREVRGAAPYPLIDDPVGEDAQEWVSRSRGSRCGVETRR